MGREQCRAFRIWGGGEGESVICLEGFQTSPARPSRESSMKIKMFVGKKKLKKKEKEKKKKKEEEKEKVIRKRKKEEEEGKEGRGEEEEEEK